MDNLQGGAVMNEQAIRRQLRAISAALRLVEASRRRLHRRFEHLERELQSLQPLASVEPLAASSQGANASASRSPRPSFFSSGDPTYALLLEKYSELNPGRLATALASLPPSLASQVHEDLEKLRLVRPIPGRL